MLYLSAMRCLIFPKAHCLQWHERSCEAKVKRLYPSREYHPSQTIFEEIEEEGITIPPKLKYSRYWATFDIEVNYPAHGTNLPEKQDKPNTNRWASVWPAMSRVTRNPNVSWWRTRIERQRFRPWWPLWSTWRIAEQAGELEWQSFAPLLNRFEETWGVSYQPSPSPASVSE